MVDQVEVRAEQNENERKRKLERKFKMNKKWKELNRDSSGNISLRWVLDKGMEYTSKKRSTTKTETLTLTTRKHSTPKINEKGKGLNTLKQNGNLIFNLDLTTPTGKII